MEPKIRFKGFEGEWKSLPFSEIVERTSTSGQAGMLPGIEFEDIVSGEGCFNKNIYQKECHKYGKLFNEGDILFGKLRPYLKNIILADFNGVAIGDFWVLRSKGYDKKYLYTLVNSESFLKVANISSGSKMPRADWNLVSTTKFVVPSSKEEQKAIGKFFTSLDSQISASTSRLASLKQMKAASLQAMFPQEGETVPKVRFKGVEGEWKKVKVSTLLEERREFNKMSDEYPLMAFIANVGVADKGDRYDRSSLVNDVENKLYKKTDLGDFIYSSNNLETGSIGLNRYGKATISPVYSIFKCTDKSNYDFIGCAFTRKEFINNMVKWRQGVMYGQWRIHESDFLKIEILIPSIYEQSCIGNYFTSLDHQITLQTQRLEKLKQIKSACLDKMFV